MYKFEKEYKYYEPTQRLLIDGMIDKAEQNLRMADDVYNYGFSMPNELSAMFFDNLKAIVDYRSQGFFAEFPFPEWLNDLSDGCLFNIKVKDVTNYSKEIDSLEDGADVKTARKFEFYYYHDLYGAYISRICVLLNEYVGVLRKWREETK